MFSSNTREDASRCESRKIRMGHVDEWSGSRTNRNLDGSSRKKRDGEGGDVDLFLTFLKYRGTRETRAFQLRSYD